MKTATPGRAYCPLVPILPQWPETWGRSSTIRDSACGLSRRGGDLSEPQSPPPRGFRISRWGAGWWQCGPVKARCPRCGEHKAHHGPFLSGCGCACSPHALPFLCRQEPGFPAPAWLPLESPGVGGPLLCPGLWAHLREDTGVQLEALGGALGLARGLGQDACSSLTLMVGSRVL